MPQSDTKLKVEIRNRHSIELEDLTSSLGALARQYQRFSSKSDVELDWPAKLYIEKITEGSIVAELVPYAHVLAPLIANTSDAIELGKNVVNFAAYLKKMFDGLLNDEEREEPKFRARDLREISQILDTTAKDTGGEINIEAHTGSTVHVTIIHNYVEANAIQNKVGKRIAALKEPDATFFPRALMYWETASKGDSKSGNKVIIESISERPLTVTMENEEIKAEMLSTKENPFLIGYIVDVELITVQGRLRAYRVLKLHETLEDNAS